MRPPEATEEVLETVERVEPGLLVVELTLDQAGGGGSDRAALLTATEFGPLRGEKLAPETAIVSSSRRLALSSGIKPA